MKMRFEQVPAPFRERGDTPSTEMIGPLHERTHEMLTLGKKDGALNKY